MLHIVNKSPFSKTSLDSCIRTATKGDPILLIEDGVLGAITNSSCSDRVMAAMADHDIYALSADVKARGVERLIDGVKVVDYAGFVDLVETHKPMSWL